MGLLPLGPARQAAEKIGLMPHLRRLRAAASPAAVKQGRRDDEHLMMLLAWALAADSNCVDVGASAGVVLEEFVRLAPQGRHVAFEPIPDAHAALVARFPGVEVHCAALADEPGSASFHHVRSRPAYSGLRERDYPGEVDVELITVDVHRLDDVLPEAYVPTLIKIDVEGGELGVLRGARRILGQHRPLLVFEHGKGAREHYGTSADDIFTLLVDELDMRLFDMDGGGPYDRLRFATESNGPRWNWLAAPATRT
ncbi:MAG: FkbM family methyltransferase [Actinomycetota bacterium]